MKHLQKILIGAVALLLILNLVLLGIIWRGHQRIQTINDPTIAPMADSRMQRQMSYLHRQLNLNTRQQELFGEALRKHHQQSAETMLLEQAIRRQLHEAVFVNDQPVIDSLKAESLKLYQQRANDYIQFTRELAESCDPDQRQIMLELLDKIPPPPGGPSQRPRRGGGRQGNH